MNTRFSRILFDYDGTLIIHDKLNEGRQVGSLLGLNEEKMIEFEKRLKDFFENHFTVKKRKITYDVHYQNIDRFIRPNDFGITAKQLDDAITQNSKISTSLASNAEAVLEYLKQRGYELCVFTNGFYKGQIENMKYKGIYDYFEKIYAWDDFYPKPDLRAFYRALAKTDPKYNVMIGDTLEADIVPAKKLGIYTVGINLESKSMSIINPDAVISDLADLLHIL